jgi:magnesium-transporting ATPase (P-type)
MLNVFEVERVINRGIEELIPIVQTILFITGEILAVVILLKTDSEALYIKKTKILSSLFIIISPIIVIIPFVFSYVMQISPIATENMGTSSTSSTSLFYILMTITLLIAVFMIYFISLYRFNILWSKSKKMLFAIFSSIVNIILTAVVLIMSSFGMLDHSLS